jgi:hypothetical protein
VLKTEYTKTGAGEGRMFRSFWGLAIFILLLASPATAQAVRTDPKPPPSKTPDRYPDDGQEVSHLPEDMRIKMAIARAEEDHKKVLEDVEKLNSLSAEIARGYGESKRLSADDIKKLGTIEKLAKHVLTQSGGEEVEQKSDAAEHMPLADVIDLLSTTVANIKKEMTAETRFVVSANVIANSNEVINLSRIIRHAK